MICYSFYRSLCIIIENVEQCAVSYCFVELHVSNAGLRIKAIMAEVTLVYDDDRQSIFSSSF